MARPRGLEADQARLRAVGANLPPCAGSERSRMQLCIPSWHALDTRHWADVGQLPPVELAQPLGTYASEVMAPRGSTAVTGLGLMTAFHPPTHASEPDTGGKRHSERVSRLGVRSTVPVTAPRPRSSPKPENWHWSPGAVRPLRPSSRPSSRTGKRTIQPASFAERARSPRPRPRPPRPAHGHPAHRPASGDLGCSAASTSQAFTVSVKTRTTGLFPAGGKRLFCRRCATLVAGREAWWLQARSCVSASAPLPPTGVRPWARRQGRGATGSTRRVPVPRA